MEAEAILQSDEWINAGGLLLLLIGISFLIAEFFIPSFGAFGFAGVAAIIIGMVQLHQTGYVEELPISVRGLVGLSILGIMLSTLGGWYSYRLHKKKVTTGIESMIGASARVTKWNGKTGKIRIQGEDWQAYSDKKLELSEKDTVVISKVTGLKIKITSN